MPILSLTLQKPGMTWALLDRLIGWRYCIPDGGDWISPVLCMGKVACRLIGFSSSAASPRTKLYHSWVANKCCGTQNCSQFRHVCWYQVQACWISELHSLIYVLNLSSTKSIPIRFKTIWFVVTLTYICDKEIWELHYQDSGWEELLPSIKHFMSGINIILISFLDGIINSYISLLVIPLFSSFLQLFQVLSAGLIIKPLSPIGTIVSRFYCLTTRSYYSLRRLPNPERCLSWSQYAFLNI